MPVAIVASAPSRAAARATTALVVIAAVLSWALAASPPADAAPVAQDSGRSTWGIQPANPAGAVPRPAFVIAADPGDGLRDNVRVTNYSLKPLTLRVYATDALNSADGGFSLLPAAEQPVDIGTWVQVGLPDGRLRLPPRTSVDIPFRISVPPSATPGDHVGGIVASLVDRVQDPTGNAVDVDQRVGSRLYLRVSGALTPRLAVTGVDATYAGTLNPASAGRALVTYTVRNEGNVLLSGRTDVVVTGPLGVQVRGPSLVLPALLPGNEATVTAPLDGVPPIVRLSAVVRASADPVVGAEQVDDALATAEFWAVPWPQLALLLVSALLVGVAVHRARRRGGRTPRHAAPPPNPKLEPVS